jgi:hypothetical protein
LFLTLSDVRAVLLILGTDVLEDVAVRDEIHRRLEAEGLRVVLRIVERHFHIHVALVAAMKAFGCSFSGWIISRHRLVTSLTR